MEVVRFLDSFGRGRTAGLSVGTAGIMGCCVGRMGVCMGTCAGTVGRKGVENCAGVGRKCVGGGYGGRNGVVFWAAGKGTVGGRKLSYRGLGGSAGN